jgi:predicted RNA methylase
MDGIWPQYDLPKTMAFHKSKSVDIQVDFFRFVRVKPKSG